MKLPTVVLLAIILLSSSFVYEVKANNTSIDVNALPSVNANSPLIENLTAQWSIESPTQLRIHYYTSPGQLTKAYSLDNQTSIQVTSNFTLTNLSIGKHNLIIYLSDHSGNIRQQDFTIEMPEPIVYYGAAFYMAPAFAIACVLILVLMLFRRHRKTANSKQ